MNNLLLLDKNLRDLFFEKDPFKVVEELEGNVYREYANRVTKEFYLNNKLSNSVFKCKINIMILSYCYKNIFRFNSGTFG